MCELLSLILLALLVSRGFAMDVQMNEKYVLPSHLGGTIGLFLGASLVSAVEACYWIYRVITWHLFLNIHYFKSLLPNN